MQAGKNEKWPIIKFRYVYIALVWCHFLDTYLIGLLYVHCINRCITGMPEILYKLFRGFFHAFDCLKCYVICNRIENSHTVHRPIKAAGVDRKKKILSGAFLGCSRAEFPQNLMISRKIINKGIHFVVLERVSYCLHLKNSNLQ